MARRSIKFTERKIAERIRQGHGQGIGKDYKGWFTVRDFSTKGIATRFASIELDRTLLFLSNIELNAFLVAAWKGMVDYWEQYPLDRSETQDIAKQLGVKHPIYVGTGNPVVMTLDGVATFVDGGEVRRVVYDSKPRFLRNHRRTEEKLAIHAEYARRRGWEYVRFSEASVPPVVVQNLEWMRSAQVWPEDVVDVPGGYETWAMRLHKSLKAAPLTATCGTVRDYCRAFELDNGLPPGPGLRCLRLLMLHNLASFNIEIPHLRVLRGPLSALNISDYRWQPMARQTSWSVAYAE
jgi:hypothetical protein